ncbi:rhomboid family intramembrane serine protease [Massilia arenosa]|uniref:Rhomboid family intramembrane serine protease n=1 Tax=Zemynaea arenosa TaxID=2561931 RepID=A0A4Y9SJX2_9BURK|nr:rhomboid family intramembrane serine protease [Massilia arenosa]TFW23004.1 rhomboid family intramembrane serine protease [Massilia arenosa]
MLIIPAENRPDWKKPPLITILLIVINVLVFFVYQGKDPKKLEQSYQWYGESGLVQREYEPFRDYLRRTNPVLLQQLDAEDEEGAPAASALGAQFTHSANDKDFIQALHKELDGDPQWRADRARFEQLINSLSDRAYAFNAKEARWDTWFTSMFLHGSVMHLLGNMVFLFIFGFALEAAIGSGVYLLLYLCSGLGGTLLYWASELGKDSSALGASGAISGLMGMYIALYGLRKINFFYNVIFFSGHVRAPALIVFPVWVGYELLGSWNGGDGVAHWAHTGGMLFGFVLLAIWLRFGLKYDRNYVEKIDPDAPFKSAHARIQELMVAMKPDEARQKAMDLVKAMPQDARAWRTLYGVVKISPASREYHQIVHSLFKQAGNAARDSDMHGLMREVAHDYVQIGGETPALTENVSLMLAQRLGRVEHIKPLAAVVERLLQRHCKHEAMPRILQAASILSAKANLGHQAQHFRAQLEARFPDSQEARQLAAHPAA